MEPAGSRILVTGGAGFIGSHLVNWLVRLGARVAVVDNLSTGSLENLPQGVDFHYVDLASPHFERELPDGPFGAVCHLAAQSSGEVSHENPGHDLQVNAGASLRLTRWCLERGIGRFLYASSMAVYGGLSSLPAHEDYVCQPLSYYGISKLASEHYLRLAQTASLSTTAFRMFSVYGPGQNLRNLKQGMVSIYLAYLLRGEPITVKGSLDRIRDFVYIDDVIEAWVKALQNPAADGKVYNVGTGKPTRVRELLSLLIRVFGQDPSAYPIVEEPPTPGDQAACYGDISRIRADLGWAAGKGLQDGLTTMVAWSRQSPASD